MKRILLLGLALFLYTNLQAQFGARGGIDLATIVSEVDGYEDKESYTGYAFGLYYGIRINDNISLRPEVSYLYFDKVEEINLKDQLYAPLLLDLSIGDFGILFGPSATYWFNMDDEGLEPFILGANAGVYYSTGGVKLEVRYDKGISNMASDFGDDISLKKNTIQIGLTYSM